jgi:hypothetical protein
LKDYIQVDRELFETNNSDSVFNEFTEEMLCFQNTNICIERSNNDKSVNNYGYKFIDFLHTNNLFILNGRTKGDLLGNTTSHDVSTIDYFTCSSNIFSTLDSLNVIEFCPLLSDIHNPINLNILVGQTTRQNRQQDKQAPNLLKIENTQEFINNISRNQKLIQITNNLSTIENKETIDQNDIDIVIKDLLCLFTEATTGQPNQTKTQIRCKQDNKSPSWFGKKCRDARKKFHIAKDRYKYSKNANNKTLLRNECKNYKNVLNKYNKEFKMKNITKLKNLGKSNPRKYWNILNGKKTNEIGASLNDLYEHFQNVNKGADIIENENYMNNENNNTDSNDQNRQNINYDEANTEFDTNCLNNPITIEEIEKVAKTLKNNKSPGIDEILNEHIKLSLPAMKNIYEKLFNIVLNTGIIP